MQFKIQVKPNNRDDSWWEDCNKPEVTDQASAEKAGRALVKYFNDTLRPGESPRSFLAAELTENNVRELHEWTKSSLTTVFERGRMFDRMRCDKCGITAKRFGMSSIVIDPTYRARAFQNCDTARALLAKRTAAKQG